MRRLIVPFVVAALISAPAWARADVVSTAPAANATVAPISRMEVTFSEKLVTQSIRASLDMIEMPGMKMNTPMKMKIATSVGADGMTLIVTTAKPLPEGRYELTYHIVSADTHRADGVFGFKVQ